MRPLQNPQMRMQFKAVAAQRAQTYQIDRQASEQRTTQKCAADEGFAKVSISFRQHLRKIHPQHGRKIQISVTLFGGKPFI